MVKVVTDLSSVDNYNDPDPQEEEKRIGLTHIVDLDGYDLSCRGDIVFEEEYHLLQLNLYESRRHDFQEGGWYWGNSHEEIDRFYSNTVSKQEVH